MTPRRERPLPKVDRAALLERESIAQFENLLPEDEFLFRAEHEEDEGVDGSLDLVSSGQQTNCRAQVQLKSTDHPAPIGGKFYSVTLTTSAFSYLLQGPSPLIVVYFASTKKFFFAWAREELLRIEQARPNWTSQQTVNIRVSRALDNTALQDIHARILAEAHCNSDVHEFLVSAPVRRNLIAIDKDSLSVTTPETAHNLLRKAGLAIIVSGHPKRVVEMAAQLVGLPDIHPSVHLVTAYAFVVLGHYRRAQAELTECELANGSLPRDQKEFLETIRHALEFGFGRIGWDEYFRRHSDLLASMQQRTLTAAEECDRLRHQATQQTDNRAAEHVLEELRRKAALVESDKSSSDVDRLQARMAVLGVEGDVISGSYANAAGEAAMRRATGVALSPAVLRTGLAALEVRWQTWQSDSNELLAAAQRNQNPIIFADTLFIDAGIRASLIRSHFVGAQMLGLSQPINVDAVRQLIERLALAEEYFERAGCRERRLRARMATTELHEMIDERDEAKRIASEVLPEARSLGFARIQNHAEEILAGRSILALQEQALASPLDEDEAMAAETNDALREYAKGWLQAFGLPLDRLPVAERAAQLGRTEARTRLEFCRHLQMLEDRPASPTAMFQTDPMRRFTCDRHGFRSSIPNQDGVAVLTAFKSTHCVTCTDQLPKNAAQPAQQSDDDVND